MTNQTSTTILSKDEETFLNRVAITLVDNGITNPTAKDMEEAMKACINRDGELRAWMLEGVSEEKDTKRTEMARDIYDSVRSTPFSFTPEQTRTDRYLI